MNPTPLPLAADVTPVAAEAPACSVVDGCLVCGDVAVPVTVVEATGNDALCVDDYGQRGTVAIELVAPVVAGDRLLVHGGAAIALVEHAR